MDHGRGNGSSLERVVAVLEEDIRNRGLRPGDRYLTTQEVASMLGISTRFANEAMGQLASRNVLMRRPKAGTTIGPAASYESDSVLDVVHLLIRQDYFFSERGRLDQMVTGLSRALPGTSVQFSFVPVFNELAFVDRLVKAQQAGQLRAGYLIAVKSPQVQDFFQRQNVPAVLMGTPYPGITLPWQDKDQRQVGHLLARYIVQMGHRKIALIVRDRRGLGDDLMVDAVTHEVLAARLGSGALTVRSVPTEAALTDSAVRELLQEARPTAVICRTKAIYESVARVATAARIRIPDQLLVALCDPASDEREQLPTPVVRLRIDFGPSDEGEVVGRMLADLAVGRRPEPDHNLIPVKLQEG